MPNAQTVVTSESEKYKKRWIGLCKFLDQWFYRPDYEALRIAICVYVAHHYLDENPICLYVIGPPGSGKTSIVLKALSYLDNVHPVTDLTTNSFISGFGDGKAGLLYDMAKMPHARKSTHGVLTFPDFTGFLQKNENVRDEVMGQIRQLWDGRLVKPTGNRNKPIDWSGKVSLVAATTPAIEQFYKLNGELGERFLSVRWPNWEHKKVVEWAMRQVGHENEINSEFMKRVRAFVDKEQLNLVDIEIDGSRMNEIKAAAILLAKSRCPVSREKGGSRSITDVPQPEYPTRIIKAACQIIKANACVARRGGILDSDLKFAKRVIVDSIPSRRKRILDWIPLNESIRWMDLMVMSGIRPATFIRTMEDMKALGIVTGFKDKYNDLDSFQQADDDEVMETNEYKSVRYTKKFRELIVQSGIQLRSMTGATYEPIPD